MGAQASRPSGACRRVTSMQVPEGTVESGAHSKLPEDATPFPGPKLEYLITNITTQRNVEALYSVMTTHKDSYYPALVQAYQDGFKLTKFQTIPGVCSDDNVQYQGIFTRPVRLTSSGEEWRLKIHKSYINPQEFFSVSEWSTNKETHVSALVMKKVEEMSKEGARFVCIEPTGKQETGFKSITNDIPVVGVDLFFHLPQNPNPSSYVYRSMNVPVTYSMMQVLDGMHDLRYQCHTDLQEQLTSVLQQGWKLVDICLDSSSLTKSNAFSSGHMTMSSMWFYEKEASHLGDSMPCWEGTIISYQHQVKNTKNGGKLTKNTWDPILMEMGHRGWELACILETPETHLSGSSTRTTTLLLVFQRPISPPAALAS